MAGMQLPSQCFQPYASPLTPSSASNSYPTGASATTGYVTGQAPWSGVAPNIAPGAQQQPQQRTRLMSMEPAPPPGEIRRFSSDMTPLAASPPWPGTANPYQPQMPPQQTAGPVVGTLGLGPPMPMGFPSSSPTSPGLFAFHPSGAGRPQGHVQYQEAASTAPASLSTNESAGPLPQMPMMNQQTHLFAPSSASQAVPMPQDRTSVRSALCKQAFQFVDALRTGYIDVNQNKTALTMVFDRLGDLPMPKEEWYARVFRNFVGEDKELIDYKGFKEIVRQWDEHHQKKRMQQKQQQQQQQVELQSQIQQQQQQQLQQQRQQQQQLEQQPEQPQPQQQPRPSSGAGSSVHSTTHSRSLSSEQGVSPQRPAATPAPGDMEGCVTPPDEMTERERGAGQPHATLLPSLPSTQARTQASVPSVQAEDPAELARTVTGLSRATAANIASEVMFPTYVGRLAIFDDYEFFGDVGSGTFGKVMVVRHRNTKQLRACKVVAVQTALQRELIDTEIKLLKSLNHPNIMKMHEVYFEQAKENGQITNGNIYLVTELCEGGDLFFAHSSSLREVEAAHDRKPCGLHDDTDPFGNKILP
mmetsp:Transcript_40603/g.73090  ORF Transcript_40603/g.73090 Transcript_40603/m.73090 type:complete len:586 (+) Transcript_40603:105-1862(+)